MTRIQKRSGPHLQQAWRNVPHVTNHEEVDVTDLENFRKSLKDEAEEKGLRVTLLPFLMKAVTAALTEFPRFNASLSPSQDELILKRYFHIGFAVDTPAGLMVPVVRDVDQKSIVEISAELQDLGQRARDKKLKPSELKGGTFTISSLGGIGGTFFTPIIDPPQVAILGLSESWWKKVYDHKNKTTRPRYILPFSLSYDHRVIDGAAAARFTDKYAETLARTDNYK